MALEIAAKTLKYLLDTGSTLALIDVREHGEYNAAHIPGTSSLPRRLLEWRIGQLVPCRDVQIVLCDDAGSRAQLARRTLQRLGYTRVTVLDGGVNGWAADGYPTEWGMNVPSKDFGEMVEIRHHVPTIDARELRRRLDAGERLVILDTRTPEEYHRFTIPGSRNLPNGELPLRIARIVREQPDATVVIHCAGRTRSIIGARALQRLGLRNVVSLRNGTAGWTLAGYALERGADRTELPEPTPEERAEIEARAEQLAAEDGVRFLSVEELQAVLARRDREAVYLIDVRTEAEFAAGHIPGFWWFPGGQAVQRSDDVVAVRNGTIVFCDDGLARAAFTAAWYRQMGFPNVYAVRGGTAAWQAAGLALETGSPQPEPAGLAEAESAVRRLSAADLQAALTSRRGSGGGEGAPAVIFVDTSQEFAQGHPPGAHWVPRGWLELRIGDHAPDRDRRVVVVDNADGLNAALAGAALRELGYADVAILDGGMAAWRAAALPLERGLTGVMSPPDDVVAMGPDRSSAEAIHYLRWEIELGRKYEQPTHASTGAGGDHA